MDAGERAERILSGDARCIARLVSEIENFDSAADACIKLLYPHSGHARVFGITGPPGSGKSTLTDKLIAVFRSRDLKVAVVAVDPSSPFSGGAILGDRIRMQAHACDDGVFIRSLASRGFLGGLSRATGETVRVLDAAGYDVVIVETVGVGQSEVDIVRLADTVILVSVPGMGDDIQAIKAGIMEIGDIFVVNKADHDGADRVVREIKSMLEIAVMNGQAIRALENSVSHHADSGPGHGMELPPVLKTVAETGEGVEAVALAALAHVEGLEKTGKLLERRKEAAMHELTQGLGFRLLSRFESGKGRELLVKLSEEVTSRAKTMAEAVILLEAFQ